MIDRIEKRERESKVDKLSGGKGQRAERKTGRVLQSVSERIVFGERENKREKGKKLLSSEKLGIYSSLATPLS